MDSEKTTDITIITPTIGRGRTKFLRRLSKSICETQRSSVQWIIVNDSQPSVDLDISDLTSDDKVHVTLLKATDRGKNNAIYQAIPEVESDYFTILNDKDILVDCLHSTITEFKLDKYEIAYILDIETNLNTTVRRVEKESLSTTLIAAYRKRIIRGDKLIVYNSKLSTEIFSKTIFDEKYFPEDIVHLRAHLNNSKYRLLYKTVLKREYLKDGITHNSNRLILESPLSYALYAELTRSSFNSITDIRSLKILIRAKQISFTSTINASKLLIFETLSIVIGFIIYIKNSIFKK